MVDITKATESSYVDADLINNSPSKKGVVLTEGEFKQRTYNGSTSDKLELIIEIDGKKKSYSPNKASAKNLMMSWGSDSKYWVGKIIQFRTESASNGKNQVIAIAAVMPTVSTDTVQS